jgi:hypothetical protein
VRRFNGRKSVERPGALLEPNGKVCFLGRRRPQRATELSADADADAARSNDELALVMLRFRRAVRRR